jgi:predicted nucleic acid-binding Zn ribbon protein
MPEKQPESEASDESQNDSIQNDSIQNDSIQHDPIQHDPTGLELAQTVARSLGAQARRRRRSPSPKRVGPQMSGARADDRDPKPLSDAVERLVETKGWTTEINVHTLLARWALLVGATNAAHSQPEGYADTVLTVRADSTAWATQLRYLAPQLVAMLNDQLGDGTVTRIKVLGPDAPSWKKGRLSVRDGRGPRDTYG